MKPKNKTTVILFIFIVSVVGTVIAYRISHQFYEQRAKTEIHIEHFSDYREPSSYSSHAPILPAKMATKTNLKSQTGLSLKNNSQGKIEVELEEALQKNPKSWSDYEKLGDLLIQQGRLHEAITLAKECQQIDIHAPYCSDIAIIAYEAMGDDKQLVASIQECRKNRNGDFFCVQKERDYLLSRGDFKGAEAALRNAFNFSSPAGYWELLARFYSFTKEFDKSQLA